MANAKFYYLLKMHCNYVGQKLLIINFRENFKFSNLKWFKHGFASKDLIQFLGFWYFVLLCRSGNFLNYFLKSVEEGCNGLHAH